MKVSLSLVFILCSTLLLRAQTHSSQAEDLRKLDSLISLLIKKPDLSLQEKAQLDSAQTAKNKFAEEALFGPKDRNVSQQDLVKIYAFINEFSHEVIAKNETRYSYYIQQCDAFNEVPNDKRSYLDLIKLFSIYKLGQLGLATPQLHLELNVLLTELAKKDAFDRNFLIGSIFPVSREFILNFWGPLADFSLALGKKNNFELNYTESVGPLRLVENIRMLLITIDREIRRGPIIEQARAISYTKNDVVLLDKLLADAYFKTSNFLLAAKYLEHYIEFMRFEEVELTEQVDLLFQCALKSKNIPLFEKCYFNYFSYLKENTLKEYEIEFIKEALSNQTDLSAYYSRNSFRINQSEDLLYFIGLLSLENYTLSTTVLEELCNLNKSYKNASVYLLYSLLKSFESSSPNANEIDFNNPLYGKIIYWRNVISSELITQLPENDKNLFNRYNENILELEKLKKQQDIQLAIAREKERKIREEAEAERIRQEEEKRSREATSSNTPSSSGIFEQIFEKLSQTEKNYFNQVLKMNPDPANKVGLVCSKAYAKCDWCGKQFSYNKTYSSRIQIIHDYKNPLVSNYGDLMLGLGFALMGNSSKNSAISEWSNDLRNDLKLIQAGNIYFCSGKAPKYCSKKCQFDAR
jgi:hypothetical protein